MHEKYYKNARQHCQATHQKTATKTTKALRTEEEQMEKMFNLLHDIIYVRQMTTVNVTDISVRNYINLVACSCSSNIPK